MRQRWKIVIGLAVLLLLPVAAGWIAHLRARQRLLNYRNELLARGEKLAIKDHIPPAPTNGVNGGPALMLAAGRLSFPYQLLPSAMKAMRPGTARVAWQQQMLSTDELTNLWPVLSRELEVREATLTEIRTSLKNPFLQFDLQYNRRFGILMEHLTKLKTTASALSAATLMALHEKNTNAIWENLRSLEALFGAFSEERSMISQLVRMAMMRVALAATWEALDSSGLDDSNWAELQAIWQRVDLWTAAENSMGMERALGEIGFVESRKSSSPKTMIEFGKGIWADPNDAIEKFAENYPRFWAWKWWASYDEERLNMQLFQEGLQFARAVRTERIFVPRLKQLHANIKAFRPRSSLSERQFTLLLDDGAVSKFMMRVATLDTMREMLVTAIALKRYQLRHGEYPPDLAALTPEFLPALPRDLMEGKPLRYRVTATNRFLLYSVGEDGKDDGGDATPAKGESSKSWWQGRDWVWPMPASDAEIAAYNAELETKRAQKKPAPPVEKQKPPP